MHLSTQIIMLERLNCNFIRVSNFILPYDWLSIPIKNEMMTLSYLDIICRNVYQFISGCFNLKSKNLHQIRQGGFCLYNLEKKQTCVLS